jgi:hypothetical protein
VLIETKRFDKIKRRGYILEKATSNGSIIFNIVLLFLISYRHKRIRTINSNYIWLLKVIITRSLQNNNEVNNN